MMPIKYKPTEKIKVRSTGKIKTTYYYIKSAPEVELLKIVKDQNTKPKLKQKCLNELVRRRING
jgi:hypothetical protein